MDFRVEKLRVFQTMLEEGLPPEKFDIGLRKAGVQIPVELKDRWLKQMMTAKTPSYGTPKLINHFFLGADPEFAFLSKGQYTYAENMGLNTLRAFGADMSGRQAELRAYPSRSALGVLASVFETFRWLNVFLNQPLVEWSAIHAIGRDGCGGHIHFGRKRPYRAHEIKNLDIATDLLLNAGVLDAKGQQDRIYLSGYGRKGDYRLQPHGYEYRSVPTWLSSPEVAHLVLTVAKLTLLHKPGFKVQTASAAHQIMTLLAAYKALDDDAAIAFSWIRRNGLPMHQKDNFKPRWGISANALSKNDATISQNGHRYFIPEVIKPSEYSHKVLHNYLVNNKPIPIEDYREVTWDLFELPKDVHNVTVQMHVGGLSEIASGLVSKGINAQVYGHNNRDELRVYSAIALNPADIKAKMRELLPLWNGRLDFEQSDKYKDIRIGIPATAIYADHLPIKPMCQGFRELIADTKIFPICRGTKFNQTVWPKDYGKVPSPTLIGKKLI